MTRWWHRLAAGALATLGCGLLVPPAGAAPEGWTSLFNGKDLTGWYKFIPGQPRNADPQNIFQVKNGEIYATGQVFSFVSTEKEYDNYRLRVDFKWGQKKWPPRENAVRDAGILYHCVGPDKVWNKSLELQIQEGDTGDMWLTSGEGGPPELTVLGRTYRGGRVVKWAEYEKPHGEWNTTMVVAKGAYIEHWVNGKVNLVGKNASLTRGRINLQSEGAEVYYKNIYIQPLK